MKLFYIPLLLTLASAPHSAQTKPSVDATEEQALRNALTDNASSTVDLMRAIEQHLAKYPNSSKRPELDRAMLQGAVEVKDWRRVALYGERVLQRQPEDATLLDHVSHALLEVDPSAAERVLEYGRRMQTLVARERATQTAGRDQVRKREQLDRAYARSFQYQANALLMLGRKQEAVELARQSYAVNPSGEEARFLGKTLAAAGQGDEAIRYLAESFVMPDPRLTEADRLATRELMGALYKSLKGSEGGLGDEILAAFDRSVRIAEERRQALREIDPNAGLTDPLQFTLRGLSGEKLELATLKGKIIVMDFWATWCGPCRAQYPMYEEVKRRFKDRKDVVFLGINTDEDRSAVQPFVEQQKWTGKSVYFEDGLQRLLKVSSIPTTIIFDKNGVLASRMDGFLPDRFTDQLTERIAALLKAEPKTKTAAEAK
jgi:thiol-disulfide isomerase/thioredoxin